MYYYGARYYDPRTSVWQSADPILGQYLDGKPGNGLYNPMRLGLYTYGANNPLIVKDPDGKFWQLAAAAYSAYHAVKATYYSYESKYGGNPDDYLDADDFQASRNVSSVKAYNEAKKSVFALDLIVGGKGPAQIKKGYKAFKAAIASMEKITAGAEVIAGTAKTLGAAKAIGEKVTGKEAPDAVGTTVKGVGATAEATAGNPAGAKEEAGLGILDKLVKTMEPTEQAKQDFENAQQQDENQARQPDQSDTKNNNRGDY